MSGFVSTLGMIDTPFLTAQNFHRPSFFVGLAVAKVWTEYREAYLNDKRRAALSLGDYLWRLSEAWQLATGNEDAVRIALKTGFKLIDLKKAGASLAVIEMEREYEKLLPKIQRILERKHPLPPGAKRSALFFEISKILPQITHPQILKWDEEGITPSEITRSVIAEKYKSQPSTAKRLLSQVKKLNIDEIQRRDWLQHFNTSDVLPPVDFEKMCDYFLHRLLPLVPVLRDVSKPLGPLQPLQPNPDISRISHSFLFK